MQLWEVMSLLDIFERRPGQSFWAWLFRTAAWLLLGLVLIVGLIVLLFIFGPQLGATTVKWIIIGIAVVASAAVCLWAAASTIKTIKDARQTLTGGGKPPNLPHADADPQPPGEDRDRHRQPPQGDRAPRDPRP
jgi:glucose dehydrogenase